MPAELSRRRGSLFGVTRRTSFLRRRTVEEVVMTSIRLRPRAPASEPVRTGRVAHVVQPVGRFALHLFEMCVVMCAGAVVLSVLFFGAAGVLGYPNLPETAPELSVFVIALHLSVPMLAWMRYRGMAWRPTLEMAGSTMVVGLALIVAYWLDLLAKTSLIDVQTSLACPMMLGVMLARFRLYSGSHSAHSASESR
jgi:hypothetical protein